jgi:hypothetical protein
MNADLCVTSANVWYERNDSRQRRFPAGSGETEESSPAPWAVQGRGRCPVGVFLFLTYYL